jgi:transposase-like protein
MSEAIAEYNSGRIKLATAAKKFGVPRNTLRRKAAEHNDNDCRGPVAYNRKREIFGL